MGRSEGNLCSRQEHVQEVLNMRVQDPREHQRQLWCPKCGTILDRDENAARNLAAGGLRFSPDGPPGEAMVEEREPENATPILKADGGKISHQCDETYQNP